MRLAVGFNPVMPVHEAARIAIDAEKAGFESFWMHESLYQRDVVTYLSAVAASTSKIMVASGVINTFTRHPVTAATTFATLSEASGGRAILGLGLGSFPTVPLIGHRVYPVVETRPLKRIAEYVEVVRRVWSGEKVDFQGEFYTARDLQLGFRPAARIPLFIASLSPMTQRFAGSSADGVILSPSLSTVERTGAMVGNVKIGEEKAARRVERASYMLTSVHRDERAASDAVRGFYFFVYQLAEVVRAEDLAEYGVSEESLAPMKQAWKKGDLAEARRLVPQAAIDALAVSGRPDQALDRIRAYERAGVTLPIVMPIGDVGYALESLSGQASPPSRPSDSEDLVK
jgi:5,10-methylenetetrahydromethanopterin reductase